MPSQNAVMGPDTPFELPQTEVPVQDLAAERNAAKFSRTKEFKELQQYLLGRIAFYQKYLPNGEAVSGKDLSLAELGARWMSANTIVAEFQAIIDTYEQAQEAVARADRPENR